jgi:hypothetical protein
MQTGYPSIGLDYFTFEQGPVPKQFWLEIKDGIPPDDLKGKVILTPIIEKDRKEIRFTPKADAKVDFSIFSNREVKILKRLAFIFQDATAKEMSAVSHEENKPWEITMREKGKNAKIDYMLALNEKSPINPGEAKENLQDHFAIIKAFDIEPSKK